MPPFQWPDELMFIPNSRAPQKTTDASLAGKVCLISGATSGVGLAGARRLAQAGAHIVMLCRNRDKGERVRREALAPLGVPTEVVGADFTDLDSVRRAADALLSGYPRIDVLINSAGLHSNGRTTTPAGFETVLCVNHLAPCLLTRLLLDRLKASAPARIINVNSEGHRFQDFRLDDPNWERHSYGGLKGYGASKTAQLLTTWEFADRLAGSGVTINAMHPGDVRTNIGMNNGPVYRWFKTHLLNLTLKDPVISGEALYYLAAAPELAGVSGRFFHLTIEETPMAHALNREKGRKVWDWSLQAVGLGKG